MQKLTPEDNAIINKLIWKEKHIYTAPVKSKGFCSITKNKRFDSLLFKGCGSKNLLKQYLAFNANFKCVAQINDVNGFRQFIPYESWDKCWNAYQHTGIRHRYLYEMILSDRWCKPYLDIEWKTNQKNEDCTIFLVKLKTDLKEIFAKRYHVNLDDKHILLSQCHRECKTDDENAKMYKMSFHVVLNIIINDEYFAFKTNRARENNSAWDLFVALIDKDPETYKNKIDQSVYSLDREFRCIYSTKYGDTKMFTPVGQSNKQKFCDNYLDYFVTHFAENIKIKQIFTPPYINPHIERIKKVTLEHMPKKGNHVIDYKSKYVDDMHQEIIDKIMELLMFVHPTAYFTNIGTDGGYRFSYTDRTELCFTSHTHKNNGFCVYIRPNNGNIYMYCYSTKCSSLYKLGNLHIDATWKTEAVHINNKFLDFKTKIKFDIAQKEDLKFSGLVNNFIDDGGMYVVKSPMGSGKTQMLKKIIPHFDKKRIIYPSHRQTFSHNIAGTFQEFGFYNYLNGVIDLETHDRLIVQIDSLVHLINPYGQLLYYDVIILDEIESLLNHLSSPTLTTKRTLVCMIIGQLIRHAKWVLALDADFGTRGYEFLCKIKNEKPKVIINDFKPRKKNFIFSNKSDKKYFQLFEDIKNKKNVVIICLSKNTLDELYDKITKTMPKVSIIRYTSMTDDQQKEELNDVNKIWSSKQCVLYSPTIESGVNFDKEHFNKIYCFLSNGSCSPRSLLQMIGRIRTTTDDEIVCCYDKTMKFTDTNTYIPSIGDIEDIIVNKSNIYNNYTFTDVDDVRCELVIKKDAFTRTFAHNYLEGCEKQVRFMSALKELIVEREWTYIDEDAGEKMPDTEDNNKDDNTDADETETVDSAGEVPQINIAPEEARNSTVGSGNTAKTIEIDDLLDAPVIDNIQADDYEKRKAKNKLTRVEKLSLKKYWILKKFKMKPDELSVEFLDSWYGKEHVLDNLEYALGTKKIDDVNDPYLNCVRMKIDYLNIILKVYKFKSVLDFDTVVEKTDALVKRMQNSHLLDAEEYEKLIVCFGKRDLQKETKGKFEVGKFTVVANIVLNDFGVGIESYAEKITKDGKQIRAYKYKLIETKEGIRRLFD